MKEFNEFEQCKYAHRREDNLIYCGHSPKENHLCGQVKHCGLTSKWELIDHLARNCIRLRKE